MQTFMFEANKIKQANVRFEVFMMVKIQIKVFWVMTQQGSWYPYCNTTWHHNTEYLSLKSRPSTHMCSVGN
jgi:hypothetical protein